MGNKVTTLNLDEDDIEELKRRGYGSISEVCRRAIKAMLGDYFDDVEVFMKLQLLKEESNRIDEELFNLNRRINNFNNRKSALAHEIAKLEAEHVASKRTVTISQNIKLLNPIIISNRFDVELTRQTANEIIEDILFANPQFDLDAHVSRMKEILEG